MSILGETLVTGSGDHGLRVFNLYYPLSNLNNLTNTV